MTPQQEVILLQLLTKIGAQSDHSAMDQQVLAVLTRLAEKQEALFELLSLVHARLARLDSLEPHEPGVPAG